MTGNIVEPVTLILLPVIRPSAGSELIWIIVELLIWVSLPLWYVPIESSAGSEVIFDRHRSRK